MGTQGVEFCHRVLDAREPDDLALLAMPLRLAPLLSPAGEASGGCKGGRREGEGGEVTLVSVLPVVSATIRTYTQRDLMSIVPLDAEPEEVQVSVCLPFRLPRPHADIDRVNGGYEQSGRG